MANYFEMIEKALKNGIMNGLSYEDKDDAYDALMTRVLLEKGLARTIECNPNGNRSLIVVDGKTMNQSEFSTWLFKKELKRRLEEEDLEAMDDDEDDDDEDYDGEDYDDDEDDESVLVIVEDLREDLIAKALRQKSGHYLEKGNKFTYEYFDRTEDGEFIVKCYNVKYGRPLDRK